MGIRRRGPIIGIVAPLAGSVDRNLKNWDAVEELIAVAPLAGSVDRNELRDRGKVRQIWSLPSRGAWIEITGSTSANSW